jgi:uncharacterized repeat protein (TIGR03803 family)
MQCQLVSFRRSATKSRLALAFAVLASLSLAASAARAQTFTLLYSFPGGPPGANPGTGSIIAGPNGTLLGDTSAGGFGSCSSPYGCGVVFSLSPTGTETVLHTFLGSTYGDGAQPSGLVLDTKTHVLYGIASGGGVASSACVSGCGTVFSIDGNHKETNLHSFAGSPDANLPLGNLVLDADGNLYGATFYGGGSAGSAGPGTIFEINSSGAESLFYVFGPRANGTNPNGSFLRDSAGNFIGATTYGGGGSCNNGFLPGCGVIYKVDPAGNEMVLHSFTDKEDGEYPNSLFEDSAGNIYGKAGFNNYGDVFEIDTAGDFSVLYNERFAAQIDNLILGPSGSFYGTAGGGSSACNGGCGLVFQLTPNGNGGWIGKTLHSFSGADGQEPDSLILIDGVLYGATYSGGASGYGTVFKIVP